MKDSKGWIDERAPKHLSSSVLSGALYIHNGKVAQEKTERTQHVLNKIGKELTSYATALVQLPELMELVRDSKELKEFGDELHTQTIH